MERRFMQEAIWLAMENVRLRRGGPFGAVVVRDGNIVSRGTNLVLSSNDPTAHAEVVAIRAACRELNHYQLTGCDLYTSCEPCPMCLGAINWARPARVFYAAGREDAAAHGFDDLFIYQQFDLPFLDRKIPLRQLMRDEALASFEAWDKLEDKPQY